MTVPTFSRVEIRHDNSDDVIEASQQLRRLADELQKIAASAPENMVRIAAHHAIRDTSILLRGIK